MFARDLETAAMPSRHANLLQKLCRLAAPPGLDTTPDADLLARFVRQGDQDAFAALVARHGPMVLRVCRHILGNSHDAEDCLQATFLVLARQAASLRRPESLAAFLHGVALRVAKKARTQVRAPAPGGAGEPADPRPDPLDELTARELLVLLDEEVARLPEAYRLAVVHCGLEGRTAEEAARLLGWTPGSVKGRLERGRARLHARLVRRGVLPSAALLALELSPGVAPAALPAAMLAAAANTGGASPPVTELAEGVLKAMSLWKLKAGMVLAFAATLLAVGGMVPHRAPTGSTAVAAPAPLPRKPKPKVWSAKTRKAVAALKADIKTFELVIRAPCDTTQMVSKLPQRQRYHTVEFFARRPKRWDLKCRAVFPPWYGVAFVGEDVGRRLIDHLADEGYFDRAGPFRGFPKNAARPSYSLLISIQGDWPATQFVYDELIGWGPKMYRRLRGIRKLLDGEAAGYMDRLLAALEPERKKWPAEDKVPRTSGWGAVSDGLRCRVQAPVATEQGMPLEARVELSYDAKRLPAGVKAINDYLVDAFLELELVNRATGKRLTVTPYDPTKGMPAMDTGRSAVPLDGRKPKPWAVTFPLVKLGNSLTPGSWTCRVRYSFPKGPTRWWREGEAAWARAGFWHGIVTSDTFRLEVRKETPKTRVLLLPKQLHVGKEGRISYRKEDAAAVTVPVRNGHLLATYIPPGQFLGGVPAPGRELGTYSKRGGQKGKVRYTIEVFETPDPPCHMWMPRMKILWTKTFLLPGG